jgi:choline dehydrogenase-like flavoprotein
MDIDVVHDLPGVGENLQDHLEMYLQYKCKQPVSLYPALNGITNLQLVQSGYLMEQGLEQATSLKQVALFVVQRVCLAKYSIPLLACCN